MILFLSASKVQPHGLAVVYIKGDTLIVQQCDFSMFSVLEDIVRFCVRFFQRHLRFKCRSVLAKLVVAAQLKQHMCSCHLQYQ
jgi:hypothetical protein